MTLFDLMEFALTDLRAHSLQGVLPELILCATIIAILIARVVLPRAPLVVWYLAMAGAAAALWTLIPELVQVAALAHQSRELFTGMLVNDSFAVFLRAFLIAFVFVFIAFAQASRLVSDESDAAELSVLVFSAAIGMCMMVAANHLLMVFLAIEMAGVPGYVLAAIRRDRRLAAEAALKYAVYGAAASGVMLYGISLLGGALRAFHLPTMAQNLVALSSSPANDSATMLLIVGSLMTTAGLAFKLSVFPFHFWTPDVFEGAPAEIGAFLSVASKAAALGLTLRLALAFSGNVYVSAITADASADRATNQSSAATMVPDNASFTVLAPIQHAESKNPRLSMMPVVSSADQNGPLAENRKSSEPARKFICALIGLLAAATCTVGNLAAYGQTSLKRLLAYSTIAHAGYLLMAICAAAAASGTDSATARAAASAMLFYIVIYFFMNFGAFAAATAMHQAVGRDRIDDWAGFGRRSPATAVCFAAVLFSLVGVPPLAGFAAKFVVFGALVRTELYLLLGIGVVNTVLSLFYYLRVVRIMFLDNPETTVNKPTIPLQSPMGLYLAACALPLVFLFLWWDGLWAWCEAASVQLIR